MSFSQSLKKLRLEKGLTQSQLAEALGISKSAISMYECGNREPELDVLEQFADFFGVDLNALAGRETLVNEESFEVSEEEAITDDISEVEDAEAVTDDSTSKVEGDETVSDEETSKSCDDDSSDNNLDK